jgi:hypothetical protein
MPWWKRFWPLAIVWLSVVVLFSVIMIWHITTSQTPEMTLTEDQRAEKLGEAAVLLLAVGLGIIWFVARRNRQESQGV